MRLRALSATLIAVPLLLLAGCSSPVEDTGLADNSEGAELESLLGFVPNVSQTGTYIQV